MQDDFVERSVRDLHVAIAPAFIAAHGHEARGRELRYIARRSLQQRDRGLGFTRLKAHAVRPLFRLTHGSTAA